MEKIYYKVSSITNAQRGQKLLATKGISSRIEKIQSPRFGDGCGYTIVVATTNGAVEKILIEGGIRIVGVEQK